MDLSILIVSFNTRELTLDCLRSVYAQTIGITFEVIVVDNESSDGSADAIARRFPDVVLIRSGKNLGFSAANNLGARSATGEFLLLLNPDTKILNGAIQKVVAFARNSPGFAIFGGRTFFGDGSLNPSSCHGRPTVWSMFCKGLGLSSVFRGSRIFDSESLGPWKRDTIREVDAVTGCFFLIRRELWDRLGGFDESFFMYGEETDLCLRARRLGAPSVIVPAAELIHYGGASERVRSTKMVQLFRAKARLFENHWHPRAVWFGRSMLQLWAFTRLFTMWVATQLGFNRQEELNTWREVYRRRSEYAVPQGGRREEAIGDLARGSTAA